MTAARRLASLKPDEYAVRPVVLRAALRFSGAPASTPSRSPDVTRLAAASAAADSRPRRVAIVTN
jgi:hypothetical protein